MSVEINRPDTEPCRRRGARNKLITASVLILVSASIWLSREALLRYAAQLWIVSDDVGPADAVVVLGGGIETRPFAAAEDYRKGLTRKVLVSNVGLRKAETLGVLPSHVAINRGVLTRLGVPEADIENLGAGISTTYEEANALRDWAIRNHARSVIVPTEGFSSRRVRWIMTQALAGTGTAVQLQALAEPDYSYADWWKTDKGLIAFQNEVIKYLYYRYRYSYPQASPTF
jgi:uncharacterized SAM-binding protein YcdF (DUF218 family)